MKETKRMNITRFAIEKNRITVVVLVVVVVVVGMEADNAVGSEVVVVVSGGTVVVVVSVPSGASVVLRPVSEFSSVVASWSSLLTSWSAESKASLASELRFSFFRIASRDS